MRSEITTKEKIRLTGEQETLLIPLYSRAVESREANPLLVDTTAEGILECIDYDFDDLETPRKTRIMLCLRAKKIDTYARKFLDVHPESIVLHLGCGLDSRCMRVNNGEVDWFDLDMPEVIDLRQRFFGETDRYHMIASSVTELDWMDDIPQRQGPVLVIAEGLLMYLTEVQVKALISKLYESFPEGSLVFDAYSVFTKKRAASHPSFRKTGAVVQWGIDDPGELEEWVKGLRFEEEWFFTEADELKELGFWDRIAFRIAGMFTMAKKAHRILIYSW